MLLNKAQREAIDNLAAMFFEKSDDLVAVSSQLERVIERRYNIVVERDYTLYFSTFDSKPELKSERIKHDVREEYLNKSEKEVERDQALKKRHF